MDLKRRDGEWDVCVADCSMFGELGIWKEEAEGCRRLLVRASKVRVR